MTPQYYTAYVSEQNLLVDDTGEPVEHPDIASLFGQFHGNYYNIEVQMN